MEADSRTLARARQAMRKAIGFHLFDANVGLIDFGLKEKEGRYIDSLAIRIHVRQKLSGFFLEAATIAGETKEIPEWIDGFPTDVQEGIFRHHQWWWSFWSRPSSDPWSVRSDPMRGGISISDERRIGYGTLGGLVQDRDTGDEMILSNWHVLVGSWGARAGQRIYQPGRRDGGTRVDTVATLTRDAMSDNLDAAVAKLTGSRKLVNDQLRIGPVQGVRQIDLSVLGREVRKSGRRTHITSGLITGIAGTQKMTYSGIQRMIHNVITIDPIRRFDTVSDRGDSGSWWLDRASMEAVGLHFAGSNRPERALAIEMQPVLDALNVTIAS